MDSVLCVYFSDWPLILRISSADSPLSNKVAEHRVSAELIYPFTVYFNFFMMRSYKARKGKDKSARTS